MHSNKPVAMNSELEAHVQLMGGGYNIRVLPNEFCKHDGGTDRGTEIFIEGGGGLDTCLSPTKLQTRSVTFMQNILKRV